MIASPVSFPLVDDFLSRRSGGHVFIINQRIVFKCPTVFDNAAPQPADEMKESAERIAREKAIYTILTENRHILRCILLILQGLLLERMETTLQARIDNETLGSYEPRSHRARARLHLKRPHVREQLDHVRDPNLQRVHKGPSSSTSGSTRSTTSSGSTSSGCPRDTFHPDPGPEFPPGQRRPTPERTFSTPLLWKSKTFPSS